MFSTRGRYALRIMIDLAEHRTGGFIPLKEVATRQEISLKYIEKIMPMLTKAGFIEGAHGKGGGYRLTRDPADYRVGDILKAAEEDLAPVSCLQDGAAPCPRAPRCRTLPMWSEYYRMTTEYFDNVSLESLMDVDLADEYSI